MSDPLDAFYARYEQDVAAGARHPAEHYQSLWPEHAAAIGEVFAQLGEEHGGDSGLRHFVARHVDGGDAPAPRAPERIAGYALVRLLGSGGMGDVWLAEQEKPRRPVALKVLRRDRLSADGLRRFEHEAELLARLRHPSIAQVYATGTAGAERLPYIAMEYVEGDSLARRLADYGPGARRGGGGTTTLGPRTQADAPDVVRLVEKVARALHAAHEAGVVHRDVKPGNILVRPSGDPVICDFGIARDTAPEHAALTRTGQTPGTPLYMSPEQIAGREVDRRSDVWSLGVTLYESLAGRPPFEAPSYEALRDEILNRDPAVRGALARRSSAPRDLEVVLEKALEKEPDRRYPTAAAFADDLAAVLERRPIAARRVSPFGRAARWARREPARAALALVLAVTIPALASVGTWYLAKREDLRLAGDQRRRAQVEGHLEDGFFHLGEMDVPRAGDAFRAALALDPESVEAKAGLALGPLRARNPAESLAVLAAFEPLPPALLRVRAEALRRDGRTREADALAAALPPARDSLEHFLDGMVALARGQAWKDADALRASVRSLTLAIMTAPRARALDFFELAYAAGHAQDRERAREIAAVLTSRWPESGHAWARAAFALKVSGADLGAAIDAAREAARLLPELAATHNNLASMLAAAGRFRESLEEADIALRLAPRFALAHDTRSNALMGLGRFDEGEAEARQALALDPGNPRYHNQLGLQLMFLGRTEEARACFEHVLELEPDFAEAHTNLGHLFRRGGESEPAIAAYRKALSLKPDQVEALSGLSLELAAHGGRDEAIRLAEKAVALAPLRSELRSNLGLLLKDAGRLADAEAALREALRLDAGNPNAHGNLGHVLFRLRRYGEARDAFEKAHEIGSRRQDWKFPSARWVEEAAHYARFESAYEAVKRGESPRLAPAGKIEVARVASARGDPREAARLYAEAFDDEPALEEDLRQGHRYDAACAAIRAADAAKDGGEAAALRERARTWLAGELEAWRAEAAAGRLRDRSVVRRLQRWQSEPAFDRWRVESDLAKLADAERVAWTQLWSALASLLDTLR